MLKVTCSSLLSNVQVENSSSNSLNLKNVDNSDTANDSSKINMCSSLLLNVQVENSTSNSLNLKNADNSDTANDSSEINSEIDNNCVSHMSDDTQSLDDTQSFDSSETDISRNNKTDSTFNDEVTNSDTSFEYVDNKDGLSVFYTNADNLMNKIDELKVRLHLKSFDVLVVTEVYPKTGKPDDIQLSELHIDGYNIFRSNVLKLIAEV